MPRNPPDNLQLSPYSTTLRGVYRPTSWINGARIAVRSSVRSDILTDKRGTIIGRDRYRSRWLLCVFSDGSVDWFHVDRLKQI